MKTFYEHLLDVAAEKGFSSHYIETGISSGAMVIIAEEANKRYTTAAIKEHLSRAAENARAIEVDKDYNFQPGYYPIHAVDRESITNIDIKLP